jgi:hypothetical protein
MRSIMRLLVIVTLTIMGCGCATVGCEVDPFHPKKALKCEMPLG